MATSLESIIGKTRIDDLDTLPLVDIDYNIHRMRNRVTKRIFDVLVSALGLLTVYPLVWILRLLRLLPGKGRAAAACEKLPRVLWGHLSLVGRSADSTVGPAHEVKSPYLQNGTYLGPEGIAGLVQLHASKDLSREERERYELYYAKNQSMLLDVEILLKWMMNAIRG